MTQSISLSEFEIIQKFFSGIGGHSSYSSNIDLGVGDDCAILSIPEGHRLAVSIDTLVAGRHFLADAPASDIAQRAIAVSISDLAAMGAIPVAFTLALSLPESNEQWLQKFSQGLRASAEQYKVSLIGGDTTRGPLAITIQVHGFIPAHAGLLRSRAQPEDLIFVSGYLGDAAAALDMLTGKLDVNAAQSEYLYSRFYRPTARIELGKLLVGIASSAIDISDGLLADLGHIVKSSSVAATIFSEKLPLSRAVHSALDNDKALCYALTGGDDYELCFTAPSKNKKRVIESAQKAGVSVTQIGRIESGKSLTCLDAEGIPMRFDINGYQHF